MCFVYWYLTFLRLYQICVEQWGDVLICGKSFFFFFSQRQLSSHDRTYLKKVFPPPIKQIGSFSKRQKKPQTFFELCIQLRLACSQHFTFFSREKLSLAPLTEHTMSFACIASWSHEASVCRWFGSFNTSVMDFPLHGCWIQRKKNAAPDSSSCSFVLRDWPLQSMLVRLKQRLITDVISWCFCLPSKKTDMNDPLLFLLATLAPRLFGSQCKSTCWWSPLVRTETSEQLLDCRKIWCRYSWSPEDESYRLLWFSWHFCFVVNRLDSYWMDCLSTWYKHSGCLNPDDFSVPVTILLLSYQVKI